VLLARIVTIPQKLERIRRLESDKSCSVIIATYDIGLSSVLYKKQKYQFVWCKEKV
jgi:hypothetical protein